VKRRIVNRWSLYSDMKGYGKANRAMDSAYAAALKAGVPLMAQNDNDFDGVVFDILWDKGPFASVQRNYYKYGVSDTAVREIVYDRLRTALAKVAS